MWENNLHEPTPNQKQVFSKVQKKKKKLVNRVLPFKEFYFGASG